MPKRNRQTLKERYRSGYRPSAEDLWDLIDSTVNILDDGFAKQAATGMALWPTEGKNSVLSVFRESGDDVPQWQMEIDRDTGNLLLGTPLSDGFARVLVLKPDGSVELGNERSVVSVNGTVEASACRGTFLSGEVPADGGWHAVGDWLEGCWALEVVAGYSSPERSVGSVVVATAMHSFGVRRRIAATASGAGFFHNKIRLKWVRRGAACRLHIKSRFKHQPEASIRYAVSKLWDSSL